MLKERYSDEQLQDYTVKRQQTRKKLAEYDQAFMQGDYRVIYAFGENLVDEDSIQIEASKITIPGYSAAIDLNMENPYAN